MGLEMMGVRFVILGFLGTFILSTYSFADCFESFHWDAEKKHLVLTCTQSKAKLTIPMAQPPVKIRLYYLSLSSIRSTLFIGLEIQPEQKEDPRNLLFQVVEDGAYKQTISEVKLYSWATFDPFLALVGSPLSMDNIWAEGETIICKEGVFLDEEQGRYQGILTPTTEEYKRLLPLYEKYMVDKHHGLTHVPRRGKSTRKMHPSIVEALNNLSDVAAGLAK